MPAGHFRRLLLARTEILGGLAEGAAALCSGESISAAEICALAHDEAQRCESDHETWWFEAADAGKSIELPESEVAAGVRCYACGGTHYNVDCPSETTPSASAAALASYLRGSRTLASASAVIFELAFAHRTLLSAGLNGGRAFSGCLAANAAALERLSDACERALDALPPVEIAGLGDEASIARSLLFACVDSLANEAGLQENREGSDAGREIHSCWSSIFVWMFL